MRRPLSMTLTANLPRWARFAGLRGQAIPVSVAALLVGSMLITAVSLYGATSATDAIALGRQSEGIIRAIRHKTLSLARELKMQTVWSEAFQHTVVAPDPVWMRQLFGEYLTSLLGYDGIYVLDPAGTPMMTFPGAPDSYAHAVAPVIGDLVDAVTRDTEGPLASFVERSRVAMGGGQSVEHRAIGDVRAIGNDIAIVLVETIVPDSWPAGGLRPPALMVALYHLDPAAMGELGGIFDYRNIVLLPGRSAEGVIDLRTLDGRKVGALSWEVRRPGTAIIGRMAWGLGLSVLLLLALGWAVLRIVDRQTRTIMAAERRVFEAEARRTRDRIAEQERNLAHAAFVSDTVAHFDAEMNALAADMEQAIAGLERSATSIVTESELTRRETERISEVVAAASACSATVAQAAEHLTRSVAAVRRAASNTARISNHAVSQATDIQVQMKALASATSEINQVVKLIGSIADQTNLLALNATIEAARAGAAGRGFAVVASEVKSLAGATGQAADDVGRQILAVQERTAGAIEAMRGILSVISQMTIVSDEVGSALADQDEVAGALIESSEGMASSMDLVVSSIAAVQEASSSAHRSARTVTSSADAVAASTERFGGTVRSLIRRVAAS